MIIFITEPIEKAAYEEMWRYIQFQRADGDGWITEGETISSCTVTIIDLADGSNTSTAMKSDATPYSNTKIKFFLKAGTAGHNYLITIKIVTSNSQKFEARQLLKVV